MSPSAQGRAQLVADLRKTLARLTRDADEIVQQPFADSDVVRLQRRVVLLRRSRRVGPSAF